MSLVSGSRIGHYEIVAPLGSGGMGEVYRALDSRLGRHVALKLLPQDLARDPARIDRFRREARTVASLNHPHIVTIYSVEQDAETDAHFLTMEYVEGQLLSSQIPAQGLPLSQLLPIAIAIVDAVVAAHQAGIVHRDLKPANVMLTASAPRVKVLDFGLAKMHAGALAGTDASTETVPITADGRIVGTVAYMSPEQAEGRATDARSDIFSLGVMLFEMATGRRPFAGNTSISLITSILRDTPPSLSDIKPELPIEFARIVRRCLQKDPLRRYQTALDLRNALEELQQESDSGALTVSAVAMPSGRRRHTPLLALVGIAAVIGAVALWATTRNRSAPANSPDIGVRERQVTSNPVEAPVAYAALSPDGRYMAYSDVRGLQVRFVDTGETRTVPVPPEFCFT
jgi:serine/threonine protein kinase